MSDGESSDDIYIPNNKSTNKYKDVTQIQPLQVLYKEKERKKKKKEDYYFFLNRFGVKTHTNC
jgi:hypothetical protein